MGDSMVAPPRNVRSSKLFVDSNSSIHAENTLIVPSFEETSDGGYGFNALIWRTSNGCHNIDFKGALDAGHGYCCGSLPCYITA
jgi:hypothetical protein